MSTNRGDERAVSSASDEQELYNLLIESGHQTRKWLIERVLARLPAGAVLATLQDAENEHLHSRAVTKAKLTQLSKGVLSAIFTFFDASSVLAMEHTCRRFRCLCVNDSLFYHVTRALPSRLLVPARMSNLHSARIRANQLPKLASCSPRIKRLTLDPAAERVYARGHDWQTQNEGHLVSRFGLLEELDIAHGSRLTAHTILEHAPKTLRSLAFNAATARKKDSLSALSLMSSLTKFEHLQQLTVLNAWLLDEKAAEGAHRQIGAGNALPLIDSLPCVKNNSLTRLHLEDPIANHDGPLGDYLGRRHPGLHVPERKTVHSELVRLPSLADVTIALNHTYSMLPHIVRALPNISDLRFSGPFNVKKEAIENYAQPEAVLPSITQLKQLTKLTLYQQEILAVHAFRGDVSEAIVTPGQDVCGFLPKSLTELDVRFVSPVVAGWARAWDFSKLPNLRSLALWVSFDGSVNWNNDWQEATLGLMQLPELRRLGLSCWDTTEAKQFDVTMIRDLFYPRVAVVELLRPGAQRARTLRERIARQLRRRAAGHADPPGSSYVPQPPQPRYDIGGAFDVHVHANQDEESPSTFPGFFGVEYEDFGVV